ncbi:AI-2E family transporter [Pseudopedobacter sp.]|uniref:AI-2E family transporter n=1 Tax=Pseudopedobacter sp. TaxID=1936787 RepID=UPI003340D9E9
MSVFSFKQRNILVLIALILLACLILFSLRGYITSFLGAIVIYTLFKPVYLFLNKKLPNSLSASLIILISFIIIIIPFFALGYMIMNKIIELRSDNFQLKAILYRLDDFMGIQLNQPKFLDKYLDKLTNIVQELFPSFLGGAFDVFLGVVLMYFVLYFMFVQMDKFESVLIKYAPLREYHAKQFGEELKNTTYSNVLGQGLIAIIQGSLVSLAFFIAGINDALFWGIISIFLSFMPVIGAPLVTLPAAIILYLNGDHSNAMFIVLFTLLVLINIDNVIRFIINKRMADTHPIITVIGVVIGIPLFGFVGIVFGPLLLLWFMHLIDIYEEDIKAESKII